MLIRFISSIIIVVGLLQDLAHSAEKAVEIHVPIPNGFLLLTNEMKALHPTFSKLQSPSDNTVRFYISQEDYEDAQARRTPSLARVFIAFRVSRNAEDVTTLDVFERVTKGVEKSNKITAENVERNARKAHDKALLGIVDDQSPTVPKEEYYPFPPHLRTKTVFALSAFEAADFAVDETYQPRPGSSTYTIFFIRGLIVTLKCIAPKDELEWTRTASEAWVDEIISINPKE